MFSPALLAACLLGFVAVNSATANWKTAPYSDDKFNAVALFGDNVTMTCEDDVVPPGYEIKFWILPDMSVMQKRDRRAFQTLDGEAAWEVHQTTGDMIVTLVQEEHFGLYYCVVQDGADWFAIKKAVNLHGPHFGDLWPKYRMSVIIACSAAGAFVLLALAGALVHRIKYEHDEEQKFDVRELQQNGDVETKTVENVEIDTIELGSDRRYDNAAFESPKEENEYTDVKL